MKRHEFVTLIGGAAAAWPLAARAPQSEHARRVPCECGNAIAYRRISAGVSEARWSEGRNMIVASRFGGSDAGRAPTAVRWPSYDKLAE